MTAMETMHGVPVTEAQIDAWVAEAEAGYDVEHLRTHGRVISANSQAKQKVVPVRLDGDLLAAVDGRAEHDHVTRSEVIRAALRSYVA